MGQQGSKKSSYYLKSINYGTNQHSKNTNSYLNNTSKDRLHTTTHKIGKKKEIQKTLNPMSYTPKGKGTATALRDLLKKSINNKRENMFAKNRGKYTMALEQSRDY